VSSLFFDYNQVMHLPLSELSEEDFLRYLDEEREKQTPMTVWFDLFRPPILAIKPGRSRTITHKLAVDLAQEPYVDHVICAQSLAEFIASEK